MQPYQRVLKRMFLFVLTSGTLVTKKLLQHTVANRAVVLSTRSPHSWSESLSQCTSFYAFYFLYMWFFIRQFFKASRYLKICGLTMIFLPLSVQGRSAPCCVHLPGPNPLQPERERALPTSGAQPGGPLLRRWTHPEVTGTHTNMIKVYILKCVYTDV